MLIVNVFVSNLPIVMVIALVVIRAHMTDSLWYTVGGTVT
jgi:hypothetical protein